MAEVVLQVTPEMEEAIAAAKRFGKNATKSFDKVTEGQAAVNKNIKKTEKTIEKFGRSATKSVNGVGKSMQTLARFGKAAVAIFAARAIARGFSTVTEAAKVQEDSVNNLNFAMRRSGEFSEKASKEMQNFASQIQATSRFGDEAVLSQLALAKAFGANNEQAQQVVKAAVELAAATGKSLDEATRQVSKTLGGFAGELGEVNPAIKNLTKEQLQAGEAAKVLIQQYGGSAQSQVDNFAGAQEQLSNTVGDLFEQIGFLITQNPAFVKIIQLMTKGVQTLIQVFEDNREKIIEVTNVIIRGFLKALPFLLKGLQWTIKLISFQIKMWTSLQLVVAKFIRLMLEFELVQHIVNSVGDAFSLMAGAVLEAISAVLGAVAKIPGAKKVFKELGVDLDEAATMFEDLGDKAFNAIGTDFAGGAREGVEAVIKGIEGVREGVDVVVDGVDTALDFVAEGAENMANTVFASTGKVKKSIDATTESAKNLNAELGASQAQAVKKDPAAKGAEITGDTLGDRLLNEFAPQMAVNFLKTVKSGDIISIFKSGASIIGSAISGGAGFTKDLLGGVFVDQFANFVNEIANLPIKFLEAFEKLDKIVFKAVEALGKFVEKFPEVIDKVVNAIVGKLPELAQKLGDAVIKVIEKIAEIGPILVKAIADALVILINKLPEAFDKLAKAIAPIIDEILRNIPMILTAIFEAVPQIVKSFADAIAPIVEAFARHADKIVLVLVEGLIAAAGEIVAALIDSLLVEGGLERIVVALIKAMPRIAVALVQGLARGLVKAGESIGQSIGRGLSIGASNIGKSIGANIKLPKVKVKKPKFKIKVDSKAIKLKVPKSIEELTDALNNFDFGKAASSGGKGPLTGVKGSPIQTGGLIPPGFPNDTFPARLTSGELVVRPKTTESLFNLIDELSKKTARREEGTGGRQEFTINVMVGEQQLATALLNLDRQGFRTSAA